MIRLLFLISYIIHLNGSIIATIFEKYPAKINHIKLTRAPHVINVKSVFNTTESNNVAPWVWFMQNAKNHRCSWALESVRRVVSLLVLPERAFLVRPSLGCHLCAFPRSCAHTNISTWRGCVCCRWWWIVMVREEIECVGRRAESACAFDSCMRWVVGLWVRVYMCASISAAHLIFHALQTVNRRTRQHHMWKSN